MFNKVIALMVLALLPLPGFAREPEQTIESCHLTQATERFGPIDVYINASVLRVDFQGTKTRLVAKAPSWKVVWYSPKDNIGLTYTYEEYLKHVVQLTYIPQEKDDYDDPTYRKKSVTSLGRITYSGISCMHYRVAGASHISLADYYTTDEHIEKGKFDKPIHILQKLVAVTYIDALPVYYCNLNAVQKLHSFMEGSAKVLTTSHMEMCKKPEPYFDYPVGYKPAKNEAALVFDSHQRNQFSEMFKDGLDPTSK